MSSRHQPSRASQFACLLTSGVPRCAGECAEDQKVRPEGWWSWDSLCHSTIRCLVTLIAFGSMRVGEALALRWNDVLEDCIVIDERLYDGDLDDPKTLHGNRSMPFDGQGVMKSAIGRIW